MIRDYPAVPADDKVEEVVVAWLAVLEWLGS